MSLSVHSSSDAIRLYNDLAVEVMAKNRLFGCGLASAKGDEINAAMIFEVAKLSHDPLSQEERIKQCLTRFLESLPKIVFFVDGAGQSTPYERSLSIVPLAEHCPLMMQRIAGLWKTTNPTPIPLEGISKEALDLFATYIQTDKLDESAAIFEGSSLLRIAYQWEEIQLIKEFTYLLCKKAVNGELDDAGLAELRNLGEEFGNQSLLIAGSRNKTPGWDKVIHYLDFLKLKIGTRRDLELYKSLLVFNGGLFSPQWLLEVERCVGGVQEALKGPQGPQEVIISSSDLHADGIQSLLSALVTAKNLRRLTLACLDLNEAHCEEIAKLLRENKNLVSLNLSKCRLDDKKLAIVGKGFGNHPSLKELDLSKNDFSSTRESQIESLPALEVLNISHNRVCELPIISSLCSLDISNNKQLSVSDRCMSFLRNTKTLSDLNLAHCELNRETLGQVLTTIKDAKVTSYLNVEGNSLVGVEIANLLLGNDVLRALDLTASSIEPAELNKLLTALETNRELTSLTLSDNALGVDEVNRLANALQSKENFKVLGLDRTGLTDESIQPLLTAIATMPALTYLGVFGNQFSSTMKARLKTDSRIYVEDPDAL